ILRALPGLPFELVEEMAVVRACEDLHAFRGARAVEELAHSLHGQRGIVLCDQVERRDVAPPFEGERGGGGGWRRVGGGGGGAGARATTARMRSSLSGVASAVHPPKLWPTMPTRSASSGGRPATGAAPRIRSSSRRTSGTRLSIHPWIRAARSARVSPSLPLN